VQCDENKTRCSVIWAMNAGSIKKNQIGVKLVTKNAPGNIICHSTARRWVFRFQPPALLPP